MADEITVELDLAVLARGFHGVSPVRGAQHAEAASISFRRQGHASGSELRLIGIRSQSFRLRIQEIDGQVERSWGDADEATEDGACGVAFLVLMLVSDYTVIERSAKGTGIDYWLGYRDADPFERAARLECSGIANGPEGEARARVREKMKRAMKTGCATPVYVCVTEFSAPLTILERGNVAGS